MRNVYIKPYGFDKMYMDRNLIEDKLFQRIDQFNGKKVKPVKFYVKLLYEVYPFMMETCKILFATIDKTNKIIDGIKN